MKVGANGITIDGTNKKIFSNNFTAGSSGWSINNDGTAEFNDVTIRSSIFSSNYNLSNKTGWGILENGEFLFGQNSNNYIQNDGTNFIFSGKMVAKAGSSIEWDYIDNAPENDWENPSYIKSTYIDQTSIVSPTVSGNNGYFSGTFKVGTNGIIIDGSAKTIRSDNYSP